MSRALVIGKLWPPHAGHHACIAAAREVADEVDVVICDDPRQQPGAEARAAWVRDEAPDVDVTVVPDICAGHWPDPCPDACSQRWADHLRSHGLGPWRAVVANEPYGGRFAEALGARPVAPDPSRTVVATSGTSIRSDLASGWPHLGPATRAGLTRRVVVVGAESTGTTTLTVALAATLSCAASPEMGRHLSAALAEAAGGIEAVRWRPEDFVTVVRGQERLDREAVEAQARDDRHRPPAGGPIVVCDTDALATVVWERRYCGTATPAVAEAARSRPPLLYLITSPEGVPFVQDGLRDGEHLRLGMHAEMRSALAEQDVPWVEVSGSPADRVADAMRAVAATVEASPLFGPLTA